MKRLIDLQAALDLLEKDINENGEPPESDYNIGINHARCAISTIPSAQPQRMRGRWFDAEWENINTGEIRKGRRCSACGCGYFRYDVSVNTVSDIPNFCPNCGADMRGEQYE